MKSLFVRLLAVAALLLPAAASATYVYNTITYPGAVHTDVRGINNTGKIVGYASLDGTSFFAFTYQSGSFTALPPAPFNLIGHGINDAGIVVGIAMGVGVPPAQQGFIFNAGSYAYFSHPAYAHTHARAISNSNLITGFSDNIADASQTGWIYDPVAGTFTDVNPPGSLFTIAQGINSAGQVVGSASIIAPGAHAFLRQPDGTIVLFQIGSNPTRARGINDTGLITGFVTVGSVTQGFVGTSAGFQTLMVPGSDMTVPEAINNAGQVAGLYQVGGVTHGFIATPASMPTGTTSGGAYTFSVAVIPNFPIFIDPPVAVGYDYDTGKGDPNFATVRLPIGIGDSFYRVKVGGKKFTLAGGDLLDFRTNGFPNGVNAFRVSCIEVAAGLDPANAEAFPTEVTFVAAGMFTGTMKPLTRSSNSRANGNCDDD